MSRWMCGVTKMDRIGNERIRDNKGGRNIQESEEKRVEVARTSHEKVLRICGENSDEDGCGEEEKERKTEAEVDGQCKCGLESDEDGCGEEEKERKTEAEVDGQCEFGLESGEDGCGGEEKERRIEAEVDGQCECGLEGEGTVVGGDAKTGCVEATGQKH